MSEFKDSGLETECISLADFYDGKSVFITGGTGFLGKVVIEKLLYSCPQVKKLYLLIRKTLDFTVQERFQYLMDNPVFDRLKEKNPEQLTKIVLVPGDIVLPNLGITAEDETVLLNEVSVVIHLAASLKCDKPLKTALSVNYEGTRKVLDLCRRMEKIQVFVHVSTAYSNAINEKVEEEICPAPIEVNRLYKELTGRNDSKFMCGRPNTYIFTKALTESLVQENRGNIPTIIIKPSLLIPSNSEPVGGWVDTRFGASALLAGISNGFCRTVMSRRENLLDIIPVDYVSNLIIVAAAKCHASKDIEVFNACSSSVNPITIGEMSDLFIEESVKNGCNEFPFPKFWMTQLRWLYWIVILLAEFIPACLADFGMIQCGNQPRFIETQAQVVAVRKGTEYVTNSLRVIKSEKTRALAASLSSHDASMFPCDPSDISWSKYVAAYVSGGKKFLFVKKVKK